MKNDLLYVGFLSFLFGAVVSMLILNEIHTKEMFTYAERREGILYTYVELVSFNSCISGSLRTLEICSGQQEIKTPKCSDIAKEWLVTIKGKNKYE